MCVRTACRLLQTAACCLTLGRTFSAAFRRSLSQLANLEWLPFAAALPTCLEPRGDGFRAAMGPVCTFPTSKGRWWGSAKNQRVVTNPVLLGSLVGKVR